MATLVAYNTRQVIVIGLDREPRVLLSRVQQFSYSSVVCTVVYCIICESVFGFRLSALGHRLPHNKLTVVEKNAESRTDGGVGEHESQLFPRLYEPIGDRLRSAN